MTRDATFSRAGFSAAPDRPGTAAAVDLAAVGATRRDDGRAAVGDGVAVGPGIFVGDGLAAVVTAALVLTRRRVASRFRPDTAEQPDVVVSRVAGRVREAFHGRNPAYHSGDTATDDTATDDTATDDTVACGRVSGLNGPGDPVARGGTGGHTGRRAAVDWRDEDRLVAQLVAGLAAIRDAGHAGLLPAAPAGSWMPGAPRGLAVGVRQDRAIVVDLSRFAGLGLDGVGGAAAVRALLLTAAGMALTGELPASSSAFLSPPTAHSNSPSGARTAASPVSRLFSAPSGTSVVSPVEIVIVADVFAEILEHASAAVVLPPMVRVLGREEALNLAEATIVARTMPSPAQQAVVEPVAGMLLLIASAPPAEMVDGAARAARLRVVLERGAACGVFGVLLGDWRYGASARVRADGWVEGRARGPVDGLRGARMFGIGAAETRELLALFAGIYPQPTPRRAVTRRPVPAPSVEATPHLSGFPDGDPWSPLLGIGRRAGVVGVSGAGAHAATRALLVDMLLRADRRRRVVAVDGLLQRLKIPGGRFTALGGICVPDLTAAAHAAAPSSPPGMNADDLIDTAVPHEVVIFGEAAALPGGSGIDPVRIGRDNRVRVVLLGVWAGGVTVYVRDDGVIAAAGPAGSLEVEGVLGLQVPTLDEAVGRRLLDYTPMEDGSGSSPAAAAPDATTPDATAPGRSADPATMPSPVAARPAGSPTASPDTDTDTDTDADADQDHARPPALRRWAAQRGVRAAENDGRPAFTLRILGRPTLLWTADQPPDTTAAAPADPFDPAAAVEVTAALSTRVRDLLVFLALHPDGVRRDAAVAALWPDSGSSRPRNNLSSLIRRLRTGLHDALTAITDPATTHPATDDLHAATETDTPPGIDAVDRLVLLEGDRCRLDPRVVAVDYWTFLDAALLASGNPVTHPMTHQGAGRPDTPRTNAAHPTPEPPADRAAARQRRLTAELDTPALARLHDAHRLYRGPLAEDIDDAWIVSLREFTRRSFLTITARLVRHYVTTAPAAALAVLETTRNVEPINQSIYRDIMALQLQDGDNESAATTLRLLRDYLDDIEEPLDDDTRELARQIDLRIDL